MASMHVAGAGEGIADAFLQRLDAPALPQERVPAARAEVGDADVGKRFSRSTLAHILALARA